MQADTNLKGENDGHDEKEQRHKKEEQRLKEEVNWSEYFEGIKQLCPWSKKYWMLNKILHVKSPHNQELIWSALLRKSERFEAALFEYNNNTSVDTLYAITEKIEQRYPDLVAFWSHPQEQENNTPVPCVIVQDKAQLTDLRKKVGYTDE